MAIFIYIYIYKYVIEKDVENIASKHIFARWQAILSVFDFDIHKGGRTHSVGS